MKFISNLRVKYLLLIPMLVLSLTISTLAVKPLSGDSVADEDETTTEGFIGPITNPEDDFVSEEIIITKDNNSYLAALETVTTTTSSAVVIPSTTTLTNITTTTATTTPITTVETTNKPVTTVTTTTTANSTTTTIASSTVATTTTTATPTTTTTTTTCVVYKPATHYIHYNTCKWADNTCTVIENTDNIECRRCTDCGVTMEIKKEYTPATTAGQYGLTDYEITLLRKIVSSEYGADWVPVEEKAKIVAAVMAMVESPKWPNTISDVLAVACEPWGFNRYKNYYMSDSIIQAVDYYFAHKNDVFVGWYYTNWYGDGRYNYFHC